MLYLRSVLFQFAFYVNFLAHALMTPFSLFFSRAMAWGFAKFWMRTILFLWRHITGASLEFRGLSNLPQGGFILAAKHQSALETLFLALAVKNIVFIMKQELMYIPVFGWFAKKAGMIPIKREERSRAFEPMIEAAGKAVNADRSIVIFMEGTRVKPGEYRPYKSGVARMAKRLQCPIVPVALNTGLFWPKNGFLRYSGHVIIEFLEPLEPKEDTGDLMLELEEKVEKASAELIFETANSKNPPKTIYPALKALKERGFENEKYNL